MKSLISLAISTLLLGASSLSAATHYVSLESTNPTPPYTNWATAATSIQDAVNMAVTNDAVVVTNGVYPRGVAVTNPLTLFSVNGPQFTVIDGGGTNRCVFLAESARLTGFMLTNGYTSGGYGGGVSCDSTNAVLTNCVIVGCSALEVFIVANGWGGGAYGGTLYNCTLSNNVAAFGGGAFGCTLYNCTLSGNRNPMCVTPLPPFPCPTIHGGGACSCSLYNCALTGNYIGEACFESMLYDCTLTGNVIGASESTLYNCTLTDNFRGASESTLYNCTLTGSSASGAFESTLYDCTLTGNSADEGGGAYESTLYDCTLTGNSASYGGGAAGGRLFNCTVVDNIASDSGGGVASSSAANCIVAYNAAWVDDNYTTDSMLKYCCTVPLPANGLGNISVPPLFVDYANGNLSLLFNSPCINAGNNAYVTTATDLDGSPRIVSGAVDIGAYEYQGTGSRISYAWLQQYGLPTDGPADFIDSDHDGMNTWQEWVCGTNPTNAQSALRLLSAVPTSSNVTVTWQSVAGVNYFLERGTNLAAPFTPLATNILGQAGTTSFADTNAAGPGPFFYRVGVNWP